MFDPLMSYDKQENCKFGEIFCNYEGVLTFHCVFCPKITDRSEEFLIHYMIHFRDVFQIKREETEETEITKPTVKQEYMRFTDSASNFDHKEFQESEIASSNQLSLEPKSIGKPKRKGTRRFRQPIECGLCGELFPLRKRFKDHMQFHQGGQLPQYFECEYCGLRLNKKKNLIDHLRRKHGRKVKCSICGKMLRPHYMTAHTRRHKNERNFHCALCEKSFVVAGELTSHLKLHYSDPTGKMFSPKKFQEPKECLMCSQKFIGKTAYERHIRSHNKTPSPLYECDSCGIKIKEKSNLRSHILALHSGLPKIKVPCSICGKVFSRKYLNLHLRKHKVDGQQPNHICPICGKTFTIGDDLSAHIRQHNKVVETSPCNVCGKKFAIPGPLADHQRVHSGDKPFACQICFTKFRTKNMLYVHKTIHWTGRNFGCEICGMKFKNPAGVRSHRRKVHGKKISSKKRIDDSAT